MRTFLSFVVRSPGSLALAASLLLFVLPISTQISYAGRTGSSEHTRDQAPAAPNFRNPLTASWTGHDAVQACAEPSVIGAKDHMWYVYCASGPLNDRDTIYHDIPVLRSPDLVHWTYMGDVFAQNPGWVGPNARLRAPDVHNFAGRYYLYFTATDTTAGGSAVGVATSAGPLGPWKDSGGAVVISPHPSCCPSDRMSITGSSVIGAGRHRYIFYGGFFGGLQARMLSADNMRSNLATQTQIAIDNSFEAPFLIKRNGYFYLFASATGCCNESLSGYGLFVARSRTILGPFLDRSGHSLLNSRVGGTVVLATNGNRWVGVGHAFIFSDSSRQDWAIYEAVDRTQPDFSGGAGKGTSKQKLLMDPVDWVQNWPTVRGGAWASDSNIPGPAAMPGSTTSYRPQLTKWAAPAREIPALSDSFQGKQLKSQWSWVRSPGSSDFGVGPGGFFEQTAAADLSHDAGSAPVLLEATPPGPFLVETKVETSVPAAGCCFNYAQAGLVVYGDDDHFVKLAVVSNWATRFVEFAKQERLPGPAGSRVYGDSRVGPPGQWTWLRLVKTSVGNDETYAAYSSADGTTWERGAVWTHHLGANARVGLVAMGAAGFMATFQYVRVFTLQP